MDISSIGPLGLAIFGAALVVASLLESQQVPLIGDIDWDARKQLIARLVGTGLVALGCVFWYSAGAKPASETEVDSVAPAAGSQTSAAPDSFLETSFWIGANHHDYIFGIQELPDRYESFGIINLLQSSRSEAKEELAAIAENGVTLPIDGKDALSELTGCSDGSCVGTLYLALENISDLPIRDLQLHIGVVASEVFPPDGETEPGLDWKSIGILRPGEGRMIPLSIVVYPAADNPSTPFHSGGSIVVVDRAQAELFNGNQPLEQIIRDPPDVFTYTLGPNEYRMAVGG